MSTPPMTAFQRKISTSSGPSKNGNFQNFRFSKFHNLWYISRKELDIYVFLHKVYPNNVWRYDSDGEQGGDDTLLGSGRGALA